MKRTDNTAVETTLTDIVGSALDGHPCRMLTLASYMIDRSKPDGLRLIRSGGRESGSLDRVLTGLIATRERATTALLAVIAELLVDDPELQIRCREELARRHDDLPRWISALPQIDIYRAVRRSHVLGDIDELMIGIRLGVRHELTAVIHIDHDEASWIVDAGLLPKAIDEVLAPLAEFADFDVVEASLADVRMWTESGLRGPIFARETECWPMYRPLVQWLMTHLPAAGGRSRKLDFDSPEDVCDRFFATESASRFANPDYRHLLLTLAETGSGDPLRWTAKRVENAIYQPLYDHDLSVAAALDVPDLLRAFIRFTHAQSGIRDELTSQTLAVLDEFQSRRKQQWDLDDVS
jgi:hypothetical protein